MLPSRLARSRESGQGLFLSKAISKMIPTYGNVAGWGDRGQFHVGAYPYLLRDLPGTRCRITVKKAFPDPEAEELQGLAVGLIGGLAGFEACSQAFQHGDHVFLNIVLHPG